MNDPKVQEQLLVEVTAAREALDLGVASLGLSPEAVTLAALDFAAQTTAHTDVTEELFLQLCRTSFRHTRAAIARNPDLTRTCPPGFLQTLLNAGAARRVPAKEARPKLRLVRNDEAEEE
jgi:hypothetical protein